MSYDLDEMVNFDGKDVSLFTAIRLIAEISPEKRNPGLAIFSQQGQETELFELQDIERMIETAEFQAELERWKAERK
jgi:hypothetical protein